MNSQVKRRVFQVQEALAQTEIPDILQRVYANRGVTDPADLELSIQNILPPDTLNGTVEAAQLLFAAIQTNKSIVIVGDYDADGATSTALAIRGLVALGAQNVNYLVPNRFEFGYGLTPEIVDLANQYNPDLIVTVDNGISSIEGVQHARDKHIDVLVTDHHLPGEMLPNANVIVNPNQPGDEFGSKSLAGVGVMFYVLVALRTYMRSQSWFEDSNQSEPNFANMLDLVALGTVADVVPLDRNNRILVEQGLRRIRAGQCSPGILALLKVAECDYSRTIASDLAFYIGPRINAAGRLEDMSIGIECLLSTDPLAAEHIATRLHKLNGERREIECQMKDEAVRHLEKINQSLDPSQQKNKLGICVYESHWHQGVIGIVAARVKEKFYRPTIAFADAGDNELKGSARSIPGVHIRDVLDTVAAKHPHIITKFGGHAMAAGLSLRKNNYQDFIQAYNQVLSEWMSEDDLNQEIFSDGELENHQFSLNVAKYLRNSGPWGQGFPVPVFDGEFTVLDYRVVGEHHLKLTLQPSNGDVSLAAIAFNYANFDWSNRARVVRAAYQLDVNYFRGIESPQLLIKHLEVCAMH